MTTTSSIPWRAAVITSVVVFLGYLFTLAPTVTFWDAGELIAASKILGIPHPPGTPLYILLSHAWGQAIPFGDYAWRLNLLSAVSGSVAAGCWFLVAHRFMRRSADGAPEWVSLAAGASAALMSAFSFTVWQNAVEAEVYTIAMLTIALASWCAVRWLDVRAERRGQRLLLVLFFLGAISIGNHLLALLVGPALIALLVATSWRTPLATLVAIREERARIYLLGAGWLLLIALGLGSTTLALGSLALVLVAGIMAMQRQQLMFTLTALAIVVIGITPYLYLLLRAKQGPWINEADPSTWQSLLDVIQRAQYPIRTPLDDPTVLHGPDNPGRTITILGFQLANYAQYFDWQWARELGDQAISTLPRLAVTLGAVLLGVHGARRQWRHDRAGWWFVASFFAVTGIGLVLYMNFKPGPSIGFDQWRDLSLHEVRERDYFFIASFVAWALWMGIGLATLAQAAAARSRSRLVPAGLLALALVPLVFNFRDASRRHGADATLARDFARALLDSVPPGGILFTYGDNDTFPLWHAQAVDGYRRDVTIVCLALAETDWYQRQLRDARPDPVNHATLPAVWRDAPVPSTDHPLHQLTDETITTYRPQLADQDYTMPLPGGDQLVIPKGTALYAKDMLMLAVIRQNAGIRPVAWSVTADKHFGAQVIQQGLVVVIPITLPDVADLALGEMTGPTGAPLDVRVTTSLMFDQWNFGAALERDVSRLDANIRAMASTVAIPYAQAGVALIARGDTARAVTLLERASMLRPGEAGIQVLLEQLRQ